MIDYYQVNRICDAYIFRQTNITKGGHREPIPFRRPVGEFITRLDCESRVPVLQNTSSTPSGKLRMQLKDTWYKGT